VPYELIRDMILPNHELRRASVLKMVNRSGKKSSLFLENALDHSEQHRFERVMTFRFHTPDETENVRSSQFDLCTSICPITTFDFLWGCLFFWYIWPEQVNQGLFWSEHLPQGISCKTFVWWQKTRLGQKLFLRPKGLSNICLLHSSEKQNLTSVHTKK
jgi:hypothetical protein